MIDPVQQQAAASRIYEYRHEALCGSDWNMGAQRFGTNMYCCFTVNVSGNIPRRIHVEGARQLRGKHSSRNDRVVSRAHPKTTPSTSMFEYPTSAIRVLILRILLRRVCTSTYQVPGILLWKRGSTSSQHRRTTSVNVSMVDDLPCTSRTLG